MNVQFTDRARTILVLAYDEARRLRHGHVDSGHLLLGLIMERSGAAARVLEDLGVTLADARREVENLLFAVGPGMAAVGKLSYTPAAKKVLRHSLEEARSLNHDLVDDLHLLLAMLRAPNSAAAHALSKVGLESTAVRAAIVQLLVAPGGPEESPPPPPSHISVGPLGRTVLGLCAFLSSLAFGAFAVALVVRLAIVGPPAGLWKAVLAHLVLDLFTVASILTAR
jgi:ATP-dependent Clp protease ATP-binding subunit ClpC